MNNQNIQKQLRSPGQTKKENDGKRFPMEDLGPGIISIVFTIICFMMFGCTSTSRQSTPAEIAIQKEFQQKHDAAIKEFHQKLEAATKEIEDKQIEFQVKLNAVQEEFQQKVDTAIKEAEQK